MSPSRFCLMSCKQGGCATTCPHNRAEERRGLGSVLRDIEPAAGAGRGQPRSEQVWPGSRDGRRVDHVPCDREEHRRIAACEYPRDRRVPAGVFPDTTAGGRECGQSGTIVTTIGRLERGQQHTYDVTALPGRPRCRCLIGRSSASRRNRPRNANYSLG